MPDLDQLRANGYDTVSPLTRDCEECGRPSVMRPGKRFCCRVCNDKHRDRVAFINNPARRAAAIQRYQSWIAKPENRAKAADVSRLRKRFVRSQTEAMAELKPHPTRGKTATALLAWLRAQPGPVSAQAIEAHLPPRAAHNALVALLKSDDIEIRVAVKGRAFTEPTAPEDWTQECPAYVGHLPGCAMRMSWVDYPDYPVTLTHSKILHGALSKIIGEDHGRNQRAFALSPAESGQDWWVHWHSAKSEALAGKTARVRVGEKDLRVRFGQAMRLKAPPRFAPGAYTVTLSTLTPLVIVNGSFDEGAKKRTRLCTLPSADSIISSLVAEYSQRLRMVEIDASMLRAELIQSYGRVESIRTTSSHLICPVAGFGYISGWHGTIKLRVNAPMRWLLECAARTGLGSKRGYGFGRIKIIESSTQAEAAE